MISINLLPDSMRKKKSMMIFEDDRIAIPKEILIGVGGLVVVLLLFVHGVLGVMTLFKAMHYKGLVKQWEAVQQEKVNIDSVLNNLNALRAKEGTLAPVLQQDVIWSRNLNIISDVMPIGVWLRKLELKEGELTFHGSAVSKSASEMISVGDLVSGLKKQEDFLNDFERIDVGVIKRREQGAVSIADFSIHAVIKEQQ